MEYALLIDYGSTFTKVTAANLSEARVIGTASAHTSIETDVKEGLNLAISEQFKKTFAASSAAGGLKMVAVGLVPELTSKAASMASMGAGAKLIRSYSFELTQDDVESIVLSSPDILLLTGGTDGGNKKNILHNAKILSEAKFDFPIIVAGNRNCQSEIEKILANHNVHCCENVLPTIGSLNIEPTRILIREIFLERITIAKGLAGVLMPTPAAVLAATKLLAKGYEEIPGLGDIFLVDLGGATTDVYSTGYGAPTKSGVMRRGLPEPWEKRTVEGDIGMRYSVYGILDAVGVKSVAELSGLSEQKTIDKIDYIAKNPSVIAKTDCDKNLDFSLAALSIETATVRHAGQIEELYTTDGLMLAQTGKDLSNTQNLILTGGAIIHSGRSKELSKFALYNDKYRNSLRPLRSKLYIDEQYILASMGLLTAYAPKVALKLMLENLKIIQIP